MRDVGRTQEEFVNHEPQASDLRILRVFFQHPKRFIISFLYNISEDVRFFHEFTGTIKHS